MKSKHNAFWLGAAVLLIAVTVMAVVSACTAKSQEPFKDAPSNGRDSSPALVGEMPDGFNNYASKCIPGTDVRVTVIYHGDSSYGGVSTVVDPECKTQ